MIDASTFDCLFRQNYEPLFHFAHQYVKDEEDCHDIVSAAYESVWNNRASIQQDNVKQYLYTAVKNRSIDFLRKNSKQRSYIEYASIIGQHQINSDNVGERDDERRIVRQIIHELGSPTGEILSACYLEEKKYKEVAEEMNITVATVKKHIVKALKRIREIKKTLNL